VFEEYSILEERRDFYIPHSVYKDSDNIGVFCGTVVYEIHTDNTGRYGDVIEFIEEDEFGLLFSVWAGDTNDEGLKKWIVSVYLDQDVGLYPFIELEFELDVTPCKVVGTDTQTMAKDLFAIHMFDNPMHIMLPDFLQTPACNYTWTVIVGEPGLTVDQAFESPLNEPIFTDKLAESGLVELYVTEASYVNKTE